MANPQDGITGPRNYPVEEAEFTAVQLQRQARLLEQQAGRATRCARRAELQPLHKAGKNRRLQHYIPLPFPPPPHLAAHFPHIVYFPISNNMATPGTHVSENSYKFPALKGCENFLLWKIQMRGMYRENDMWGIVTGMETQLVLAVGVQAAAGVAAVCRRNRDGYLAPGFLP
jgi:hypothetical protein